MKILMGQDRSLLEAILALVGRSPITVSGSIPELPAGFTQVDVAVLDWIANETRRLGRGYTHH